MKYNDCGPAFPRPRQVIQGMPDIDKGAEGMSLRDYFETKQISAWIIALSARRNEKGYTDEGAVYEAIRLGKLTADTMLKAREE